MTEPDDAQRIAEAVGRAMLERDHCAIAHGIALVEIAPGYARMTMTVRRDMVNGHDIGHGGMTFTLADTAFAYACNARNEVTVAAAGSIVFPAPARLGDVLTAECREVHRQGRSGVYDTIVTNQDGVVVGIFRGQSSRIQGEVVAL
ncbi:hydroxyphenylacetyl-CoA thioesterase PaaI [Azospirillum canadense]|uniref:hydroxyphenylacetyl-CoA thioesterase PaaI n=1 Tax=Azospirillum canadense TaxID=403962 RepID=UPI002227F972|nr:hydroxyphenylacetyl-CoA thioesterase PaaI [Azospirillum canadense]MCW2235706.1 acyl-CoA thioesterase [Azospirillum canadense]